MNNNTKKNNRKKKTNEELKIEEKVNKNNELRQKLYEKIFRR